MSRVAVFGDDRGLLRQVLGGYEIHPISLSQNPFKLNIIDAMCAVTKPRPVWQAEYIRRQFVRTKSSVLISLIDNTEFFGYCSDLGRNRRTIAVQNGVRLPEYEWEYSIDRYRRLSLTNEYQHDIYVAWGGWDAERYFRLGGTARELVVAGSLVDSIHRKNSIPRPETSLLGVLEMRNPQGLFFNRAKFPGRNEHTMTSYSKSISILYRYLERFCLSNSIKPLMILNSTHELGPQLGLLDRLYLGPKDVHYGFGNTLGSYDAIDSCHVVVGVLSSLLVEAFGRSRRILAFNPSGNPDVNFPVDGIWSLTESSYGAFEERLSLIMSMSNSEWGRLTGKFPQQLVAYDPSKPTDLVVRELVENSFS